LKQLFRTFATLCIVASSIFPAVAQDTATDIYSEKCKMCHGADGVGDTPIGKMAKILSFKDPSVVKASDDELSTIIKNGKNKMPPFADKLTDDQINSLVTYIRTLQK
jgi:cytochrome c6